MHVHLEKMATIWETLLKTVMSLSDFEFILLLGVVIVAFLAIIALCIHWLRDNRKKKRTFLLEQEIYRVQETDDTGKREKKTVIDAFRTRFPLDDLPLKKMTVDDQTDTAEEEVGRNNA